MQTHNIHIFRFAGGIEQLQNTNALSDSIGADFTGFPGLMEFRKPLVLNPADHVHTVNYSVDIINSAWPWRSRL